MSRPRYLPFSMGPPVTTSVGMSTDDAPMMVAGVVLSQPHNRTTPSNGLARMDSSTSMLVRLRYSMVVGRMTGSPRLITGNSSGKPPAFQTPRFTASATRSRCALQGVTSLAVLQIPITGRPSKFSAANPWFFIHDRCAKFIISSPPNQAWLRYPDSPLPLAIPQTPQGSSAATRRCDQCGDTRGPPRRARTGPGRLQAIETGDKPCRRRYPTASGSPVLIRAPACPWMVQVPANQATSGSIRANTLLWCGVGWSRSTSLWRDRTASPESVLFYGSSCPQVRPVDEGSTASCDEQERIGCDDTGRV